jgi:glycosyltransferase involved in cell wall biosynthesis
MPRVRILYVVHQLLPPRHVAGTEIYSINLAREMQSRGHHVEMFFTEAYVDREQYQLGRGTFQGLPYHEAVFCADYESFESTYRNPRMEELFERVLDAVQPDLVHCQHLALHSIGYIDQIRSRGLPIVYTLHEYMLMCPRDGQLLRPGLQLCQGPEPEACAVCVEHLPRPARDASRVDAIRTREREIKRRLADVDLFLAPSAFLRDRFVAAGWIDADRIIHSDNGFRVDVFAGVGRVPGQRLRVGYLGTIADYKGVHLLIEAFEGIDAGRAECRIWGDLDIFPDYGRRLREMDKPVAVRLMGRFDNADVGRVLAELDVLVVPSLWFENSPLTIHEAFLGGLPVLATDQGGMAELIEDGVNGLLFRRGDVADLRAKIQCLLDDPTLLERLRKGLPAVKTIAEDAAAMERRYARLMDRAQRGRRA